MKYQVRRTDGAAIPDDEPCFVIRGQDALASATLERYAELAAQVNSPSAFIAQVEDHRLRILKWQREHARKLPD